MDDATLYRLCLTYGADIRFVSRKFAALLPEVNKRQLFRQHNFYSIYEFAAKVGQMSRKTVDEILRTYSKVEDKPLLKAQVAKFGWAKVRAITPLIATVEEEKLAEMLETLPRSAIAVCVHDLKGGKPKEFESVTFKVDRETAFKLRQYHQQLEKEAKSKLPLGLVLCNLLAKIEPQPQKANMLAKSKKVTRHIPAQQKRELIARHNGRCAFPNCNKPYQEIHHPQRFAINKSHANIVPLCKNHHHIAHAGLIKHEEQAPSKWEIQTQRKWGDYKAKIDACFQRFQVFAR